MYPPHTETRHMPRISISEDTIPESILLDDGKVTTIMLDIKYSPYEKQIPRIENICGSFREAVPSQGLEGVLIKTKTPFGIQREIYHIEGNIILNQSKASFMGARSFDGLEKLSQSLNISTPRNNVHMVVFCMKLGKRVQVTPCGLLETNIARKQPLIRIQGRLYEQNNTARFCIKRFEGLFQLNTAYKPDNNDWGVTGKGTVLSRMTWKHINWTQEVETECLKLCSRVASWLETCC